MRTRAELASLPLRGAKEGVSDDSAAQTKAHKDLEKVRRDITSYLAVVSCPPESWPSMEIAGGDLHASGRRSMICKWSEYGG